MRLSHEFVVLDTALHDRDSFQCGKDELDNYIKAQAAKHMKAGISRTLVLTAKPEEPDSKSRICAFFSITPGSISRDTLPAVLAKKLPRYPVPVFLIAQLAVHEDFQGRGLGKITLIRSLEQLARIHAEMPAYAVVVDCVDNEAERFYSQYGFEFLCTHRGMSRLFIPMKTVLKLFEN
ncbi:MAG: GNAT family N-acetyltransferase [Pseudohongiellaceae bacterium]